MHKKQIVNIIRWIARILGAGCFLLITAIAIGEGVPNPLSQPLTIRLEFLAMFSMWLGLIIAYRWEGIGSFLILGGFTFFWIVEGRIPILNIAFGPLLLTGLLFLFCWWQSKKS